MKDRRILGNAIVLALMVGAAAAGAVEAQTLTLQQRLQGPTTTGFGQAIDVDGSVAVVGATGAVHQAYTEPGFANVYRRSGSSWTLQQRLVPSDSRRSDFFGIDVAVSGNTIVVGASGAGGTPTDTYGAIYIFGFNGSTWVQQAKLSASDARVGDLFAQAVDIEGDTVVVGAILSHRGDSGIHGAAYVFERIAGTWRETILTGPSDRRRFGWSVALSGSTICVGMPGDGFAAPGAAFIYSRIAGWSLQDRLAAPDGVAQDEFGNACATDGQTVVVGAHRAFAPVRIQGAAYVFTLVAGTGRFVQKLTSTGGGANDYLGRSVAVLGDWIVLGAPTSEAAGATYFYQRTGDTWTQRRRFQPNFGIGSDGFGGSIALDAQSVMIGATVLREVTIYSPGTGGSPGSPPGTPRDFAASAIGAVLRMSWDHPDSGGAPTGYVVRARTTGGALIATAPVGLITSFNTTAPNGVYVLTVQATNPAGAGQESTSRTVTIPTSTPPPGLPTNLVVNVAGSSATFTWSAPASGGPATGYLFAAGTSPAFAVPLAVIPLPAAPRSFTVPGIPPGTYYVRLLAQNAGGMSGASNEVTLSVAGALPPGVPTLHAPTVAGATVGLSWSAGGGGAPTSYVIAAASSPGGAPFTTATLGGTSIGVPGVASGTYYLRLVAVNAAGTSPASNEVTLVVP